MLIDITSVCWIPSTYLAIESDTICILTSLASLKEIMNKIRKPSPQVRLTILCLRSRNCADLIFYCFDYFCDHCFADWQFFIDIESQIPFVTFGQPISMMLNKISRNLAPALNAHDTAQTPCPAKTFDSHFDFYGLEDFSKKNPGPRFCRKKISWTVINAIVRFVKEANKNIESYRWRKKFPGPKTSSPRPPPPPPPRPPPAIKIKWSLPK